MVVCVFSADSYRFVGNFYDYVKPHKFGRMCERLKTILSETDRLVYDYLHPREWIATLPLTLCTICKQDEAYTSKLPESIDLFDFCKGGKKSTWYDKNSIIRFDPKKYPLPDQENDPFSKSSSGHTLITDLLSVCHHQGKSSYCSNGRSNDKNSRRITCHHLLCHNPSTDDKDYEDLALRKSKAKSSATTSKRTLTGRALSSEKRCTSFFVLNVDRFSYYMKIGTGNSKHTNHAPHDTSSIILPKRLLPTDVTKNIEALGFYKVSMGSIVTISQQYNCNISRRQVSNLTNFAKMATRIHEVDDVPKDNLSDPDQMICYFKRSKIPHIILSHHMDVRQYEFQGEAPQRKKKVSKNVSKTITQEVQLKASKNDLELTEKSCNDSANGYIAMECDGVSSAVCTDVEFIPDRDDMKDMIEYSNGSRSSLLLPNEQSVMLSFMWSVPHCRRLFQAFPEVLYVDGTHATNRERMPLLTVGVRDHEFKMNVVIRAFIPNERAWLFRWIFFHGIPTLMGKDACKKVKLIITDGDSQETSQLDNAIRSKVYGDAIRRRCGWHIIEKGSTFHLHSPVKGVNFKKIVSIMKLWVQESLMKDVETEDEYNRYGMFLYRCDKLLF